MSDEPISKDDILDAITLGVREAVMLVFTGGDGRLSNAQTLLLRAVYEGTKHAHKET